MARSSRRPLIPAVGREGGCGGSGIYVGRRCEGGGGEAEVFDVSVVSVAAVSVVDIVSVAGVAGVAVSVGGVCCSAVSTVAVAGVDVVSVAGAAGAAGFFSVSTSSSIRYPQRRMRERIIRCRQRRRLFGAPGLITRGFGR